MRIARSTGAVSGGLIVALGIWAALVPFVGPYFDYPFAPNTPWHFTRDRLLLDVLPGVAALLAGALLLRASTRKAGVVGGTLAVLAGAWLVLGPVASLTWEAGRGPIGSPLYGSIHRTLELSGYFYGLGALIATLGAFAIGRFSTRPTLFEEGVIDRGARSRSPVRARAAPAAAGGAAQTMAPSWIRAPRAVSS
jgi:hypothetical protein